MKVPRKVIVTSVDFQLSMHLNLLSITSKKLCNSMALSITRGHSTATQQTVKATARSVLNRFIEERRRKSQQDDIRLEPYISKGVYTESGAIRPVSKQNRASR